MFCKCVTNSNTILVDIIVKYHFVIFFVLFGGGGGIMRVRVGDCVGSQMKFLKQAFGLWKDYPVLK